MLFFVNKWIWSDFFTGCSRSGPLEGSPEDELRTSECLCEGYTLTRDFFHKPIVALRLLLDLTVTKLS